MERWRWDLVRRMPIGSVGVEVQVGGRPIVAGVDGWEKGSVEEVRTEAFSSFKVMREE